MVTRTVHLEGGNLIRKKIFKWIGKIHKEKSDSLLDTTFQKAVIKRLMPILDKDTYILKPFFYEGKMDDIPYVGISIIDSNEKERKVIKKEFDTEVMHMLEKNGYYEKILCVWKYDYKRNVPVYTVRYATNEERRKWLDIGIRNDSEITNGGNYK